MKQQILKLKVYDMKLFEVCKPKHQLVTDDHVTNYFQACPDYGPFTLGGDTWASSAPPSVWATATSASDGHPVID